jgi:hypothetical protein
MCDAVIGASLFWLSLNVDAHITPQALIGFFTFKIFFAGINVSLFVFFEIILGFILYPWFCLPYKKWLLFVP